MVIFGFMSFEPGLNRALFDSLVYTLLAMTGALWNTDWSHQEERNLFVFLIPLQNLWCTLVICSDFVEREDGVPALLHFGSTFYLALALVLIVLTSYATLSPLFPQFNAKLIHGIRYQLGWEKLKQMQQRVYARNQQEKLLRPRSTMQLLFSITQDPNHATCIRIQNILFIIFTYSFIFIVLVVGVEFFIFSDGYQGFRSMYPLFMQGFARNFGNNFAFTNNLAMFLATLDKYGALSGTGHGFFVKFSWFPRFSFPILCYKLLDMDTTVTAAERFGPCGSYLSMFLALSCLPRSALAT